MAKRGKASSDTQLSAQQKSFLSWMLEQEPREKSLSSELAEISNGISQHLDQGDFYILNVFDPESAKNIRSEAIARLKYTPKPITWNPEKFLDREPTESDRSSIYRTVRFLEGRKLVSRGRGTVRFTKKGRFVAESIEWSNGISDREFLLEARLTQSRERLWGLNIAYDLVSRLHFNVATALGESRSIRKKGDGEILFPADAREKELKEQNEELTKVKHTLYLLRAEEYERVQKRQKGYYEYTKKTARK